jgi:hypothetical protein
MGDSTKRHPIPQKRPPHGCLGCLELKFGNSVRVGQSYSGKIKHYEKSAGGPTGAAVGVAGVARGANENAVCDGVGRLSDPLEGHVI